MYTALRLRGLVLRKLKGFTLIELLIVIAVLGVLAAAVLVAINPGEQLARARDAGRKTTIGQLQRATQAYFTRKGSYPTESATWITTLVSAGELQAVPAAVSAAGYTPCTTNSQNSYCYKAASDQTQAVVFLKLESKSAEEDCTNPATEDAYFLWASSQGQTGVVCSSGEPSSMSGYTFK